MQEEHLEGLGDLAGVMREEASLIDGAPIAVVPAAQPALAAAARGRATRIVTAGLERGDLRAAKWGIDADGRGWLEVDGVTVRPPVRGAHNLRNAMLALAVARECGVAIADAARGIEAAVIPPMRMAWEPLGAAQLINDAYNANPASVRAALDLLAGLGGGRQRVAVLGTMRELGPHADRAARRRRALRAGHRRRDRRRHRRLCRGAAPRRAERSARVVIADDVDDLWPRLEPRLARDAIMLLKASRGVRLERFVPILTAWATR